MTIENIDWYISAVQYFHKSSNIGGFNDEFNWIKNQILRDKDLYESNKTKTVNESKT